MKMAVFLALFVFSVVGNLLLFLRLRASSKKTETYDARMILHDLTSGAALVEVRRIAPADVFIRSPRS